MFYQQVCLFSLLAIVQSVSGDDTRPDEFPHQVLLQAGFISNSESVIPTRQSCGGAILNEKWILTSGRCVAYFEAIRQFSDEPFLVKAGKYRLDLQESTEQNSTVKKSFGYPEYPYGPGHVDVGLIQLSSPLKLNSHVAAVELPVAHSEPAGEYISTGWNSTFNSNAPAMQKVKTSVVDYETCSKMYEKLNRKFGDKVMRSWMRDNGAKKIVFEYNFCTEPLNSEGINNCDYAHGSPLITKRKDGKVEVVGVRSWYNYSHCLRNEAPPVYTKVSTVVHWIAKTIAANS